MSYLTVDDYDRVYLDASSNRLRDIDGTPIFYIDELYADMGLTLSDDSRIVTIEEGVPITEQDLIQMLRDNVREIDNLHRLFDKMQSTIHGQNVRIGKLESKANTALAEAQRANNRIDALEVRTDHWFSKWLSRWFS